MLMLVLLSGNIDTTVVQGSSQFEARDGGEKVR